MRGSLQIPIKTSVEWLYAVFFARSQAVDMVDLSRAVLDWVSGEYMWLAVNTWRNGYVRGQLGNDSRAGLPLRAGQTVEFQESEIFDWLLAYVDGREEGGYTAEVLRARQDG
jgi:uncharacterized protein YegJ (DUF2314 family)